MADLLRLLTCGSVDDGKSSLIGRLLFEAGALYEDQLAALAVDSRRYGTRGGELDFALALDGLSAEREQGITIDVAYRYFATPRRHFIVADTPGHAQYTRNMATGASHCDLAVILVDARKGVLAQTRRHATIVGLLGIRQLVLAVNKMDLIDFDAARFADIERVFRAFGARVGLTEIAAIPVCATDGDNLTTRSARMPWYAGPSLLAHLESVRVAAPEAGAALRFPVQWVNRPHQDFRGYAGTVVAGTARVGQRVRVLPGGRESNIARIVRFEGDRPAAERDDAVTLVLSDELDIGRGDVLCAAEAPCAAGDQFEATIIWMDDAPLLRGRAYVLKLATQTAMSTVAPIKHKIDVDTLAQQPAESLALNEIGVCELALDRDIAFEPYRANRDLGGFILIDRLTHRTVGAGLLHFALRRSANVHWQALDIDKRAHAALKGQLPCVLWFTGLSGAGKSTIANLVEKKLHALGRHTYVLDGDNIRHGLNKDLGFTAADRVENIRRVAEVARLMVDAGLIVLTAFISPFRSERAMARALFDGGEFIEVFVDTPIEVAEARDAKGLYAKARRGEIKNFTGIDSPYEAPESPELRIDGSGAGVSIEETAERIVAYLRGAGRLD